MLSLKDISTGIIKILRGNMEIEYISQEDLTNPGDNEFLHIQLIPLQSTVMAAGHFVEKRIFVDIAYMEKLHTSNKRIYEALDMLDAAFKPFFIISGRAFSPSAQMDITDDIGHYKMTLAYTDTIAEKEEALGEHLIIKWRK